MLRQVSSCAAEATALALGVPRSETSHQSDNMEPQRLVDREAEARDVGDAALALHQCRLGTNLEPLGVRVVTNLTPQWTRRRRQR